MIDFKKIRKGSVVRDEGWQVNYLVMSQRPVEGSPNLIELMILGPWACDPFGTWRCELFTIMRTDKWKIIKE